MPRTTQRVSRLPSAAATLAALRGEASLASLQAGLIRAKLASHPSRSNLPPGSFLAEAIGRGDPRETDRVCERLAACGSLTLKQVEQGFETLLAPDAKKRQGAVYTPDYIIAALLEGAHHFCESPGPPTICDPACGSGGFLLQAAAFLERTFALSPERSFAEHIFGFDKDPQAVAQAHCLIELYLDERGASPLGAERVRQCDTLLATPEELHASAGVVSGFDIVATNPPYVKLQNLPTAQRKPLEKRYAEFIRGSYSTGLLFLLATQRMLAPGGTAALIAQNNLFTSLAGEPLRRQLSGAGAVRRIVDFGHARVFPEASAYTCLIYLGRSPQPSFEFERLLEPSATALQGAQFSVLQTDRLNDEKWRLAKGRHFENLLRLESAGPRLGQAARIQVGFATLKDAVFLARWEEGCCRTLEGAEIEPEITRPAIKVADWSHGDDLKSNTLRVIFPYEMENGRYQLLPESTLERDYPAALSHLQQCRAALDGRDDGRSRSAAWYAWGRTQGRSAPGPKLLTKTFDSAPQFLLDESDSLFCNGYSVTPRLESEWNVALLSRLLHSKVLAYYLKLTSFQIHGGFFCFQKNFIERFALPPFTAAEREQFAAADPTTGLEMLCKAYRISPRDIAEVWP